MYLRTLTAEGKTFVQNLLTALNAAATKAQAAELINTRCMDFMSVLRRAEKKDKPWRETRADLSLFMEVVAICRRACPTPPPIPHMGPYVATVETIDEVVMILTELTEQKLPENIGVLKAALATGHVRLTDGELHLLQSKNVPLPVPA
jgi:hypothetical protein